MKLSEDIRDEIEESLFAAHLSADQYLNRQRPSYEKMLKISVHEAITLLEKYKDELGDDPRLENYKLHLFVPLQIHQLIEMRKGQENVEQP